MKAKAIILASVLLVGCQVSKQNAGHRGQKEQNIQSASNLNGRNSDLEQRDLWREISQELKMTIPDTAQVEKQKKFYLNKKRYLHDVTKRAEPYMYWIVEQIRQRNMPMEIVLLPIVESAFNPHAISPAKAAGIWQIVPQTGRNYGLKQNKWYDGRKDIIASTSAALDILQNLNGIFSGDWLLTIAAYNSGEGRVLRAINRNKSKGLATDFWSLNLPRETTVFVPRMLALSDLIKNNRKYGINLPKAVETQALTSVDPGKQIDLAQVSAVTGVPLSQLKLFNPGYKGTTTAPNGPHAILVPHSLAKDLQASLRDNSVPLATVKNSTVVAPSNNRSSISQRAVYQPYRVRPGDTINGIANRLNIPVEDLKRWNIATAKKPLKIGQQLHIAGTKNTKSNTQVKYHIRKGDSLYSIAKRHGVNINDVMRWNSALRKSDQLQPGNTLTLYVKPNQQSTY